jgi:methylglutaconyl-CoA hydratase
MTANNVLVNIDDRQVATVTLNRIAKHNAFDDAMIVELIEAFTFVIENSARVMILTSNGKDFSAGADVQWMQRMVNFTHEENVRDAASLAEMLHLLDTLPIPTIANVNGGVYGGAVGLVSCCDIAVGTNNSVFCLSEVKIGLIPATISPYVIAAMGSRAARRYFQTAEAFDGSTALTLGLLSECVIESALEKTTEALVEVLLTNRPQAMTAAKKLVAEVRNRPIDASLIAETCERIASIRTSVEGQEGLQVFIKKRKK